jgi:hypothetical protein
MNERSMFARLGVGAAIAALPAAVAIAGGTAGWSPWVIGVCSLVAVVALVIVTAAPYLRLLNRVPLIGSPRFRIVLCLNGRLDMRVRIDDWSNTSVLEVGILNLSRTATVSDAWMNLLVPSGVRMGRCDKVGVPVADRGRWEPFHSHRLGSHARSDYWNDDGWTFKPDLSRLLRFKLRFAPERPGEYPVLFKLGAPSLYQTIEVPGTIYVEDAPGADLGPEDQMGALITEGEQVYRKWDTATALALASDPGFRRDVMAYLIKSDPVIRDALGTDRLPQAPEDADQDELLIRVRETIDALYVIRDERGRAADPD